MNDKIENIIEKLNIFKNHQVLSVYLGNEGKKAIASSALLTEFNSLIHNSLNKDQQKMFKDDIKKIEFYVRELYDTRGKRSVVFFTSGKNLWEVLELEFYLPTLCSIFDSPYIKPITNAFKEQKKYLFLLVDRQKARLFTIHLGNIEEHEEVFGQHVPQKVRQINEAWKREDKILRHIDDHLRRHLKFIAEKTSEFAKNKHINFIVLGGHRELFSKIKKHLPHHLAKKVLDAFVSELNLPINDLFLKSREVTRNIR